MAQSIWWIASVIGLSEGLAAHIDNLRIWSEVNQGDSTAANQFRKEKSVAPRDIQEDLRTDNGLDYIHDDRISQIDNRILSNCHWEISDSNSGGGSRIIKDTEKSIGDSRKAKEALKKKKSDSLSRTRSGQIPAKPVTKKQRNYLQSIPKNTISEYLINRN